ncbi:NADPH-dependent FMN reductase [Streptomyces termitum]|uniref:FMN reductase n=1 Tax=Streptomyces termitum TaxID=67368 RepID=A0A918W8X5_9ACTN|nr:NAD(P)H-dependent oxidoreductase [Streptomyces termitum]GHA77853.1 FMN reductase [Streptomyces termitum]
MPSAAPVRLAVIVGSTREGRVGPVVADWIARRARARDDIAVDVVDIAEARLPAVLTPPDEHGRHASPELRAYAERVAAADVFVVVTPEYNRGYPAALKHAVDSLYTEWQAKPVAFVGYAGGLSGGMRAIEQLRSVFAELHAVPLRDSVNFPHVYGRFGEDGEPVDAPEAEAAAKKLLDQLLWWADALREARARRPYVA